MQDFKNKLYNYDTPPPEGVWAQIIEELDNKKVLKMYNRKRPRLLFYGITAAASIVIILIGSLFFQKNSGKVIESYTSHKMKSDQQNQQKIKDSVILNQQLLKSIINNPAEKEEIVSSPSTFTKKYLTIAGPEGHPVKISPKVATLIISADNEFPPRPVWSRKIDKWQKIMLSSTVSPTSANLVDIVELAASNDHLE
ncbi:MAG: hypothetical protein ABI237_17300 [Ginsengibacter sp.]